ncbi:recombination protein NinG, partial [Escherichia coli]|uniref:recombination protein NinG n=1 Tax=Escherichia coli TaxID=562 RepID=UPI003341D4BC
MMIYFYLVQCNIRDFETRARAASRVSVMTVKQLRKLALKPRSYWIKQAQQAVNAFIRERDRDL